MKKEQTRTVRDPSNGQDLSVESMRTQWKMQYKKVEELCQLILQKEKSSSEQERMLELAKELLL